METLYKKEWIKKIKTIEKGALISVGRCLYIFLPCREFSFWLTRRMTLADIDHVLGFDFDFSDIFELHVLQTGNIQFWKLTGSVPQILIQMQSSDPRFSQLFTTTPHKFSHCQWRQCIVIRRKVRQFTWRTFYLCFIQT